VRTRVNICRYACFVCVYMNPCACTSMSVCTYRVCAHHTPNTCPTCPPPSSHTHTNTLSIDVRNCLGGLLKEALVASSMFQEELPGAQMADADAATSNIVISTPASRECRVSTGCCVCDGGEGGARGWSVGVHLRICAFSVATNTSLAVNLRATVWI
jgi:hypothetical protein